MPFDTSNFNYQSINQSFICS